MFIHKETSLLFNVNKTKQKRRRLGSVGCDSMGSSTGMTPSLSPSIESEYKERAAGRKDSERSNFKTCGTLRAFPDTKTCPPSVFVEEHV